MTIARVASEQERTEILDWLNENNEFIIKSPRYDHLIDNACMFFYKKSATQVSEDTLNFIRRSANELLRNKASKGAMQKAMPHGGGERIGDEQGDSRERPVSEGLRVDASGGHDERVG